VDYHLLTGDPVRAYRAVDRLDEYTGGDAALTNLRAGIALHAGDNARSIRYARQAISQDADYEDPYWHLMVAGSRAADYKAAMQGVRGLEPRFGYEFSEVELMKKEEFGGLLETHFNKPKHLLCAHNGKEFDFPYLARRMIVHGIPLPSKLSLFGKKPWEVPHLDTMELWKFGDFKHYTSLKLLAHVLGIPSPKEDIDGSMVRDVYYEENDLERIVKYCERDVVTVAQVFLRLRNEGLLTEDQIVHV